MILCPNRTTTCLSTIAFLDQNSKDSEDLYPEVCGRRAANARADGDFCRKAKAAVQTCASALRSSPSWMRSCMAMETQKMISSMHGLEMVESMYRDDVELYLTWLGFICIWAARAHGAVDGGKE